MENQIEIWREITGFEGYYEVSNLGNVKSLPRHNFGKGKIFNCSAGQDGYRKVSLTKNKNKSYFRVSRLVFQAFNGDLINDMVIDHDDNNKLNDVSSNLKQITVRENVSKDRWRHGYATKSVGVTKRDGKYASIIYLNGKNHRIGLFETEKEASEKYQIVLKDNTRINDFKKGGIEKYRGVYFCNTFKKWSLVKNIDGKKIYVGKFETKEDAVKANIEINKNPLLANDFKGYKKDKKVAYNKKRCKWVVNFRKTYVGSFDTEKEAKAVREIVRNDPSRIFDFRKSSSIHLGVFFNKKEEKWIATSHTKINGKKKYLGSHLTEEEANQTILNFENSLLTN